MFNSVNPLLAKNVSILGATGTIGLHTLDVITQHPNRFNVFALTANTNVKGLFALCVSYAPRYAVMLHPAAANELATQLKAIGSSTVVLHGEESLCYVASHEEVDTVMAAIVGAAGLHPAMAAAKAGKCILLANKETLVMAAPRFFLLIVSITPYSK